MTFPADRATEGPVSRTSRWAELGPTRTQFWTCPIDGHSDGSWTPDPVVTVRWEGDVAHCLAPDCGRTSTNPIPDDGRRWWLVASDVWGSVHTYQAPNGRAAIAAYRRDLTAAERHNGRSVRDTRDWLRAARLHIAAGPIGTRQAYEHDLAAAYAHRLSRWQQFDIEVAFNPGADAVAELAGRLPAEAAARIRRDVRARYLPEKARP